MHAAPSVGNTSIESPFLLRGGRPIPPDVVISIGVRLKDRPAERVSPRYSNYYSVASLKAFRDWEQIPRSQQDRSNCPGVSWLPQLRRGLSSYTSECILAQDIDECLRVELHEPRKSIIGSQQ